MQINLTIIDNKRKFEDRSKQLRYRLGRLNTYLILTSILVLIIYWDQIRVYNWRITVITVIGCYLAWHFFVWQFAGISVRGTPFRIFFPYLPSFRENREVEIHYSPWRILWQRLAYVNPAWKPRFKEKLNIGYRMSFQVAEAVNFGLECGYPKVSLSSFLIKKGRVELIVQNVQNLDPRIRVDVSSVTIPLSHKLFLAGFGGQKFSSLNGEYSKLVFSIHR